MDDTARLIAELHRCGLTDDDIERAAGGDPDLVARLHHLVVELSDSLLRHGPGQWLRSGNRMLKGRRPIDVLADDDWSVVENAVGAFLEGAYV
jgi:uncharacterized protein (DUF2384 family)